MTKEAIYRCSIRGAVNRFYLRSCNCLRNQKISRIADCTRKHTDIPLFQDVASFSSAHHQCKKIHVYLHVSLAKWQRCGCLCCCTSYHDSRLRFSLFWQHCSRKRNMFSVKLTSEWQRDTWFQETDLWLYRLPERWAQKDDSLPDQ